MIGLNVLYQIFTLTNYDGKKSKSLHSRLKSWDEKGDETMSKTAKWIIGIVVALLILQFAMPFVWQLIFPNAYAGYNMTGGRGYGYGMHMPMTLAPGASAGVGYGFGFGFFGMLLMWLIPLGTLTLIVLGIAWLVKQLTTKRT
jgi:hypothetical protein